MTEREPPNNPVADPLTDIQELLGYDIVNHGRLLMVAESVWRELPARKRANFTLREWQAAIYAKCREALVKAEKKLAETNPDPRLLKAKVNILRSSFNRQVIRAMSEVSVRYREHQVQGRGQLPPK